MRDPIPDSADQLQDGHPHKWLVLASVSAGLVLGVLDASVVNIAVPTLMRELPASVAEVSWVLNAYNIVQAVLFLSLGRLAERYGQKLVFVISLALFTLFSLGCGLATTVDQLILMRVGQGVGAAGMVPVSLIILLAAFPRRQHGLATGLWGAMGTLAAIIGPPIGGLLIEYASWNWIFFMNVPIGLLAIGTAIIVVPELRRDEGREGLDWPGILLSAGALGCLILAIVQGNSWGWGSPLIVSLLIAAFGLGGLFLLWEKRAAHPMLDLHLFRIRSFSAGSVMTTAGAIAMGGGMLMLVLFMVNELGFTALQAAIGTIPMAAVSFVLSPFAGRLVDVFGPRYLAAAGTALFGLAFLLFAQLDAEATLWSIGWREIILGLGMSLSMPTLTAAGLTSLPHQSAGVGSGTMSTARAFGSALGVALVLAVYETVHDYGWPFVVSAVIALASLPLSFLLGRRLGDELPER